MQECCNELVEQSQEARMIVNCRKTKEMMIGRSWKILHRICYSTTQSSIEC